MLESLLTVSHLFADVAASQKAVRDHIKTLNNNKACYEQVAQKYCKYIFLNFLITYRYLICTSTKMLYNNSQIRMLATLFIRGNLRVELHT